MFSLFVFNRPVPKPAGLSHPTSSHPKANTHRFSLQRFLARPSFFGVGLIAALMFALPQTALSQGVPASVRIVKVDASAFPKVQVQILLLDANGSSAAPPSKQSLTVSENNRSVDFEMEEKELGSEIGFVMDAGMGLYNSGATGNSRLEEMKQAIEELTQDPLLLTGRDAFYVLAQTPSGPAILVNPETQATQIPGILGQFHPDLTYAYAYPLEGVNALLESFAKENSSGNSRAQAVVVLSGGMQVNRAYPIDAVAGKAAAMGIPIHTVLFRPSLAQAETLQDLAARTGGLFFFSGPEGARGLSGLKSRLMGIRRQYILTYRSPNPESGTRLVSVGNTYGESAKPALAQYEVAVQPPVVVILSPGDDQTVRLQTYRPTGEPKATPSTGIVVTGSVSWPDNHPRMIQQATLLVNGKPQTVLTSPGDSLTFVWKPPEEFSSGGLSLQIQAEDELGLIGQSDPISVRIVSGSVLSLCPAGSGSALCHFPLSSALPYLSFVIALIALGLVVAFRKQVSSTAEKAVGAASDFVQEVGETLRFKNRSMSVKAVLKDLSGNTGTGRSMFELSGTTGIGRAAKNADLVLQSAQTDSPISRLHCTLVEEDGVFFLRDDQSANGTYLNGTRLAPLERYPLKAGDEICLAHRDRGGIRLQFQVGDDERRKGNGMDSESTNRAARNS